MSRPLTPPHAHNMIDPGRVVRLVVPRYEVDHPFVVIAQHWPCWLTSVASLGLPVETVFVQGRYKRLFDEPTCVKLISSWSTLDQLLGIRDCSAFNILGSGSMEFLTEMPEPVVHGSHTFVYTIELDFRRFHRKRDLDRMLRSLASHLAGKQLDATIVNHADFGGVTNASYLVALRGIDTNSFVARDGLTRTLSHIINAATSGNHKAIKPPPPIPSCERRPIVVDGLLRHEGLFDVYAPRLNIACPSVFKATKWVQDACLWGKLYGCGTFNLAWTQEWTHTTLTDCLSQCHH
jgi:hypothetical protein